jgi:methylthioribose-1-phosphate isomerase
MQVEGHSYRSIWVEEDKSVSIVDQTKLPHGFVVRRLQSWREAATAIRDMWVRGAPLIGVTAAYGVALAMREDESDESLHRALVGLRQTRPTAVNLEWAIKEMRSLLAPLADSQRCDAAYAAALSIADEDVARNEAIGDHGLALLRGLMRKKELHEPLRILTHCNAGWLATVDWGTATAPIYKAHEAGLDLHVWVDETRPRNQGASLTAWELGHHGVAHTIVVDNAGGHLMQRGMVDLVIVGADRVSAAGDVCNKIGTYLKALAAKDNDVPFYVAAPSPTIDFALSDGVRDIPIETRSPEEITHMTGMTDKGEIETVRITPPESPALNYGFDVTPARFVTGLITERGLVAPQAESLRRVFPERAPKKAARG